MSQNRTSSAAANRQDTTVSAGRRQKALERPTPPEKGARELPPWPPSGPAQAVGEPSLGRATIDPGRTLGRLGRGRANARARAGHSHPATATPPQKQSGYLQVSLALFLISVSYTHLRAHETDSYLVC